VESLSRSRCTWLFFDAMVLKNGILQNVLPKLVVLAVVLIIWQIAGSTVSPLILTTPGAVAQRFIELWNQGVLPDATMTALQTALIGLAMGAAVGIPLGLVMGRSRLAEYALDPYVSILYATPIVVIMPLVVIWFGSNMLSSYLIVFLATVFPILINTMYGVKNVSRSLVAAGSAFGFQGMGLWRKIVIPGSVPFIVTGLRIGTGAALIGTILAELFVYTVGLGYVLAYYGGLFDSSGVISAILITMLLGILLTEGTKYLERRTSAWARFAPV
jgi:ABC-type nitrate/sulfonate/bicarbonate transport system permease component